MNLRFGSWKKKSEHTSSSQEILGCEISEGSDKKPPHRAYIPATRVVAVAFALTGPEPAEVKAWMLKVYENAGCKLKND